MSQFLVDSRTLLAVRDTLGRLHDQLLGVHAVVDGYDGLLGGRALEEELGRFCGQWHYGITELGAQITSMMRRLVAAAAAYQRIEDRIAGASHGGAANGAPRTGSPVGSGTTVVGGASGGHAGPHSNGSSSGGAPVGGGHANVPLSGSGRTVIGGGRSGSGGSGASGRSKSSGHRGSRTASIDVSSPLLTHGQETFVGKLAALTGLNPRVVAAWALAEESSGYAEGREADGNNNWLNIGYFDSGAGQIAFNKAFDNPDSAAEKTADFLDGKWGGASPSIRSIARSAGKSPEQQIAAIADSNWASSHYGNGSDLRATYHELAGMKVRSG
ncbi:MAG TPA: hypothetical protein VGL51_16325 [Solirubrobacteraceae bacterium]|jgi:hypothetical protein